MYKALLTYLNQMFGGLNFFFLIPHVATRGANITHFTFKSICLDTAVTLLS